MSRRKRTRASGRKAKAAPLTPEEQIAAFMSGEVPASCACGNPIEWDTRCRACWGDDL